MYLSALTALDRKTGKLVILASVGHSASGRDCSKVAAAYQALIAGTPDGAAKRAKYSHVLFMVDNQLRNQHQFPDPLVEAEKAARIERQEAEARLKEAQARLTEASKVKDAADAQHAAAQAHAASLGVTIQAPTLPVVTTTTTAPAEAPEITALRAEAERLDGLASAASAAAIAAAGKSEEEALITAAIKADTEAKLAKDALDDALAQANSK